MNRVKPPIDAWQPMTIPEIHATFSTLNAPWWIAGGWALDLYLGRQTRAHNDVDVAMLRGDERALRTLRRELDVYVAHDGQLAAWNGQLLQLLPEDCHQFWMASTHGDPVWRCEVLLEQHDGQTWRFRRWPAITLPLDEFGSATADGIPIVSPKVVLLYKSNRHESERNAADFRAALAELAPGDRRWLRDALKQAYRSHPWLDEL